MAKKNKNDLTPPWFGIKCGVGVWTQQTREFWYLIQITDVVIRIFKWNGLPKEIPVDIMERTAFNDGKALFFLDDKLGYFALPTAGFTNFNEYGLPVKYRAIGFNGKQWERDATDSVLIKNTPLLSPCLPTVWDYCTELANIRGAINVNVNAIKTPLVFTGKKEELLTLKNTFKQLSGNEPVIYAEEGMKQNLNTFQTQPEYVGDKLAYQFNFTLSQLLTYLGINNNPVEKAERLITAEASSNNDFINANLRTRLKVRQEACDKINEMFGLNVSVEIDQEAVNDMLNLVENLKNEDFNKGGEENAGTDR